MTITTQDGRKLEISPEYHLHLSERMKGKDCKAALSLATFTKRIGTFSDGTTYETGDKVVERYGIVGEYATDTGRGIAALALRAAWDNGAAEFTVPQDTFVPSPQEQFADFCEEHGLTVVSINELGYKPSDIPRNLHIWQTTDEFERRGILVCDPETHGFEKSLAKWQALQRKSNVVPIEPKGYVKRAALRRAFIRKELTA